MSESIQGKIFYLKFRFNICQIRIQNYVSLDVSCPFRVRTVMTLRHYILSFAKNKVFRYVISFTFWYLAWLLIYANFESLLFFGSLYFQYDVNTPSLISLWLGMKVVKIISESNPVETPFFSCGGTEVQVCQCICFPFSLCITN